jgi:hypothetical protein
MSQWTLNPELSEFQEETNMSTLSSSRLHHKTLPARQKSFFQNKTSTRILFTFFLRRERARTTSRFVDLLLHNRRSQKFTSSDMEINNSSNSQLNPGEDIFHHPLHHHPLMEFLCKC